nr:MAG TPA: hypothetical protein [Caudoviricetes sp.]
MMYYYCSIKYSASSNIFHIIRLSLIAFVFLVSATFYFCISLLF